MCTSKIKHSQWNEYTIKKLVYFPENSKKTHTNTPATYVILGVSYIIEVPYQDATHIGHISLSNLSPFLPAPNFQ